MIVLFDDECPMCVRFAQGIKFLDSENKIQTRSIHDEELYREYSFLNKEACEDKLHVIEENEIFVAGDAVNKILTEIPAAKKLMWLIDSEAAQKASNMFYDRVDKVRKYMKSCKNCKSLF